MHINYNTMWIRTQDKKQLLQLTSFSITKTFASKLKFALVGSIEGANIFSNIKVLGLYKTQIEALQEIDKIQKNIETGDTLVYQINKKIKNSSNY